MNKYPQNYTPVEELEELFNEMSNCIVHQRLKLANELGDADFIEKERKRTEEQALAYKERFEAIIEKL